VRRTAGRLASSGSWPRPLSSRSRTLSTAKSMSVPQAKRSVTRETPSRDTLSTRSMPGTAATCRSISAVTRRSTSVGATPWYVVKTTSLGYATSGSRSIGRRVNEMKPRNVTAMNSIATATGRRMERLESDMSGPHPPADLLLERDHRVDPGEPRIHGRAFLAGGVIDEALEVREGGGAQPELLLRQLHALPRQFRGALRQLHGPIRVAEVDERGAHVALHAQPLLAQRLACVVRLRARLRDLLRRLETGEQRDLRVHANLEATVARVEVEEGVVPFDPDAAREAGVQADRRPAGPTCRGGAVLR